MSKVINKTKRKRKDSPVELPVDRLKRFKFDEQDYRWSWTTEVTDKAHITHEHAQSVYGFGPLSKSALCKNKFAAVSSDIIDVDNEDETICSKNICKVNPYCLNYLGQEKWEKPEAIKKAFLKKAKLGEDPNSQLRIDKAPVGLKNLGATCYVNAALQVWNQDIAFREAVLQCKSSALVNELSPIFQLQVTLAALQEGKLEVFDPSRLVESLKLRTSEQQDAQEFSKLFMSLLNREFSQQEAPHLKTFISDQFEGKHIYGTKCHGCQYRSERETSFLELEIQLETNCTLEEQITASLASEILMGDNKYRCSGCDTLQDATRYTQITKLPPVLHISIQRFVFDYETLSRSKSKKAITFPPYIDMQQFLGNRTQQLEANPIIYELRGVLLHKGNSAFHGHYEAQVYDSIAKKWYQYNDELVTEISPLLSRLKKDAKDDEKKKGKQSTNGDKKISSRDVYMLVYVRQEVATSTPPPEPPAIPQNVMDYVRGLELEFDLDCAEFAAKEEALQNQFKDILTEKQSLYQTWQVDSKDKKGYVFSKKALADLLLDDHSPLSPTNKENKKEVVKSPSPELGSQEKTLRASSTEPVKETTKDVSTCESTLLDNSVVVCEHNLLDPSCFNEMKVITSDSFEVISRKYQIAPILTVDDICLQCVYTLYDERIYGEKHPLDVRRFEDALREEDDDMPTYWISKAWVKDWCLKKPKLHSQGEADPGPHSSPYLEDVLCEHGELSGLHLARMRLTSAACAVLSELFPEWNPISCDTEVCRDCDAVVKVSKPARAEIRRQVEIEKEKLRFLSTISFFGANEAFDSLRLHEPYLIIFSSWVKKWKLWLSKPHELARPQGPSSDDMLCSCEKRGLVVDLNEEDDRQQVAFITVDDWSTLLELYPDATTPCTVRLTTGRKVEHDIEPCTFCTVERKRNYTSATISFYILSSSEPVPTPEDHSRAKNSSELTKIRVGGRSRALRDGKNSGKIFRLSITKAMTIKELKLEIQERENVPTLYQTLYYKGHELNSDQTLGDIGVLPGKLIEIKFADEALNKRLVDGDDVIELSDDEEKGKAGSKRKKEVEPEGGGFGGTVLSGI